MHIKKPSVVLSFISLISIILALLCGATYLFWINAAIFFLACIYLGNKESIMLNPYYLFAFTPFSVLIYKNISDNYMQDLTFDTWLIIILNINAFVISLLTSSGAKVNYKNLQEGLDNNSLTFHAVVLAILGIGPIFLNLAFNISIPLYSVFTLLLIPSLCCAIASKQKRLFYAIVFGYLLTWISNVTKSSVLTLCLFSFISYELLYSIKKINKTRMVVYCFVGMLVMLLSFSFANQIRGTKTAEDQLNYYMLYGNVSWDFLPHLFMPYMYLETPWTNLQYVINTQDSRTYGLWFIKPFINYLQLDSLFESMYRLISLSPFNTFSFIACQFKDFGLWGSVIPSVFLGKFVKWVYTRALQTRTPLDVACYVYTAQAVLEMFFSNHFFQQSYPFTIVIILSIYKNIFYKYNIKKSLP